MNSKWVPTKPNFGPPPPGYIAGIGRGAHGFTTRSDLGPAQTNLQVKQQDNDEAAYAQNKFDSWEGYKGALFVRQNLDEEDRQAEQAYDFCERRIEERRLNKKQQTMKEQLKKQEKNPLNVPISQLFTDLKRDLANVTEQQWNSIPEAVDLSIKKDKKDKYVPVPDSMLVSYINSASNNKTIAEEQHTREYREAKSMLLKTNLEKAENQNMSQGRKIDRIGYLTSLDTSRKDQQFLGDIKRARLLHKSALEHNPKNPDIWLSAARIEELDGKLLECRKILRNSLECCSGKQQIWIQLSRVEKAEESKNVLIEALRHLPKSEKIWLTLARKESANKEMKSKILRRALENIPQSARLWKQIIQLEDLEQAKKLLYKAVECLPKQIDLWIGLAKLQMYENAKSVLNKARRANPLSLAIWISAAKLQETQSEDHSKTVDKIEMLIRKARSTLQKNGNIISREEWLQQALVCERSQNIITCQSIVKATIMLGLTQQELNQSIFKDVDLFQKEEQSIYTTRFLYREGIKLTKNPRLLSKLLQFEERLSLAKKKSEIVESTNFGLKVFPDHPLLWEGLVDRFIDNRQYNNASILIDKASLTIPENYRENLLLKKVKILKLEGKYQAAKEELIKLCQKHPEGDSAFQLILLQYQTGNYQEAWRLCSQLFKKKKNEQIWNLAIKIKIEVGTYQECRSLVDKATAQNPFSIKLWKSFIELEKSHNFMNKARAIIDKALLKNPKNQEIYLILIDMQLKSGNKKLASSTISKAMKQCPKSGEIWARAIMLEPHNTQKKKASVAIQNCGNSSAISATVAQIFWKDNKTDKAKNWLQQALKLDRANGDLWAYYFKLIQESYPQEIQAVSHQFHQIKKMTHGRKWKQIQQRKDSWKLNTYEILQILVEEISTEMDQ